MTEPTLADIYAQLRAHQAGVEHTRRVLEQRLLDLKEQLHLGSGNFQTPYGLVSYKTTKGGIRFREQAKLEWALEHAPHEVIPAYDETVPAHIEHHEATTHASLDKTLATLVTVTEDGTVVWKDTGEVCEWATWTPDTYGVAASVSDDAKVAAAQQVLERVDRGQFVLTTGEDQ